MTFDEFWTKYHREDPNEALANRHHLRIFLTDGTSHEARFPGTITASKSFLFLGVGGIRNGMAKDFRICPWNEIEKIEELSSLAAESRV